MTDPATSSPVAPETTPQPPPTLDIDWQATYAAFSQNHGGNPILHGGRLLFADAWTHSATSYKGPEWPPPNDLVERARLQLVYWQKRRAIVEAQRSALANLVDGAKALQAGRSAPLHHRVTIRGDDGKARSQTVALDPTLFEGRLAWLTADVTECAAKINALIEDLKSVSPDPTTPVP